MGGGSDLCRFFLKDLFTCTEGPQRWSLITEKWYFLTKVFLFPQNRSFNHIYLAFSLSNMIYALLSKKCCELHFCNSTCEPNRSGCLVCGVGAQPNFGLCLYFGSIWSRNPFLTWKVTWRDVTEFSTTRSTKTAMDFPSIFSGVSEGIKVITWDRVMVTIFRFRCRYLSSLLTQRYEVKQFSIAMWSSEQTASASAAWHLRFFLPKLPC